MERQTRVLSQLASENILTQPVRLLGTKFQSLYQIVYFQVYGNLVEENMMYQHLQKICSEKVCCITVFQANWEYLGKVSLLPKKIACSYTYVTHSNIITDRCTIASQITYNVSGKFITAKVVRISQHIKGAVVI